MFQSTRPAWGATYHARQFHKQRPVSIHAPRVGRDQDRATEYQP